MKVKIIGILMCMLLLGTIIPTISATQPISNEIKHFGSCYIVAKGELTEHDFPSIIGTSMWKITFLRFFNDDRAFVFYWFIRFNETATVTVYSEQNGEILWQHQGETVPQLRMLLFRGTYINDVTEDGKLYIEISGNINLIQIIEK